MSHPLPRCSAQHTAPGYKQLPDNTGAECEALSLHTAGGQASLNCALPELARPAGLLVLVRGCRPFPRVFRHTADRLGHAGIAAAARLCCCYHTKIKPHWAGSALSLLRRCCWCFVPCWQRAGAPCLSTAAACICYAAAVATTLQVACIARSMHQHHSSGQVMPAMITCRWQETHRGLHAYMHEKLSRRAMVLAWHTPDLSHAKLIDRILHVRFSADVLVALYIEAKTRSGRVKFGGQGAAAQCCPPCCT